MSLLGTMQTNPSLFLFLKIFKIILVIILFGGVIWSAYPLVIMILATFGLFREIALDMAIHKVLWIQVVAVLMFLIPGIFVLRNVIPTLSKK